MRRWRHPLPWLSAVLFLLNAAIASKLFRTEYLSETGSVEGVFISYARYARDHWPDLAWCRFWYAGIPFQNAYPPGLHLTAAAASHFGNISAGLAFHIVVALMYSLGPVTLFWMALRLTRAISWSFYAAMLYSLTSPAAFLVPAIRRDLGSLFWDRRLHTPIKYGDGPHVSSLTLVPLAILALDLALQTKKPIHYVAAAVALAAVPLTNWPGAIVLAFAVMAYGLSLTGAKRLKRCASILALCALGYALAAPWLPPSTVIATEANVQAFEPANRFTHRHLVYIAALALCTWAFLRFAASRRVPSYLRFFLLFFFYMAALTLGYYWFGLTLLAQPGRFHLAMEMGCVLSLVFVVRPLLQRWPALGRPAAIAFAILCVFQFIQYRSYARHLIRPIDITKTSEYKIARWLDGHMKDSRVMVSGSETFWLNAFTDTPQLTGCCSQGVLTETIPIANYGINTDLTAENRAFENTLLWFKALGVRGVAVPGPKSTEVYKPFSHPHKFDARLPVLWRDGDDTIFGVPWTFYSLAHALEPGDMVQRTPIHGVDTAPLVPYVAAIERPGSPELNVSWADNEAIAISGVLRPSQIVSVQVSFHPGWHAAVNGSPRTVFADKLGFLAVVPNCRGNCTIKLHYDGGTEMTLAHWINRAAVAGSLIWILLSFLLRASGLSFTLPTARTPGATTSDSDPADAAVP